MTIAGVLSLTGNTYVDVVNGLMLNNSGGHGIVNLGSVGASPTYGYLDFYNAGPQTLGGTGTVDFGDNSSGNNGIFFYSGTAGDKLTIAAGVTVQGANGYIEDGVNNIGLDLHGIVDSDPTTVGTP